MNKYPECCYRIGNGFKHNMLKVVFTGYSKAEDICTTYGVLFNGETTYWGDDEKIFKELVLHSISAETLSLLARENGDWIGINFREDLVSIDLHDKWMKTDTETIYPDEPLGSFFLRVAKERKYIK